MSIHTHPATHTRLTPEAVARRMLVLAYVRRHILSRCNMPTLRNILAHTGGTSLCTARNDVRWLIGMGMLVQTNRQPLEFTLPELHKAALEIASAGGTTQTQGTQTHGTQEAR